MKDLITLKDLGPSMLAELVTEASALRDTLDQGSAPEETLRGRVVANLFFEPSTRTRLSFELAAKRLGAHVLTLNPATSSASKGESLRDTVMTMAAMGPDVLVVRHVNDGVPKQVAEWSGLAVINAGDGTNEHPTQALVDLVTLRRNFGRFQGLHLGIVGDIAHSRVAGSLVHALPQLGVETILIAPDGWTPQGSTLPTTNRLDSVLGDLDVVYLLRVQTERGGRITDPYIGHFQLDKHRLARMRETAVVMHPGPINRGVEIADDVADSSRSLILEQVRNGVPTRMTVLRRVRGSA